MSNTKKIINFSEQLLELMHEDGLNQTELAEKLNAPSSKISLYLSGKAEPYFQTFVNIVELFNCSADFLAGLKDYPERQRIYKPAQPFGAQLKNILKEKGISQYYFQKTSKISWSVLHGWLTGKTLPTVANLIKVAEKLEISIDYLLGRES